jgi:hypothetical protein
MSDEEKIKKAIQTKLTNLLNCILNEVEKNPNFATLVEEVLLSDSLRKVLKEKKGKKIKIPFKTMEYLQNHNLDELRLELKNKSLAELKEIIKKDSGRKSKELKDLNQEQIIEDIIKNAQRKLNQGSSFLK